MDDATLVAIEAELTKINFLLEALWTHELVSHGYSPGAAGDLGEELLRQFQELPATLSRGGPAAANDTAVRDAAAQGIARLFAGVRARVATIRRD